MFEGTECFIRKGIGEQPVRTDVVVEPGTDPDTTIVTTPGVIEATPRLIEATPEEIEQDALILDLVGRVFKELKRQNPSPEAVRRVLRNRLPEIISIIGGILVEEEPQVPNSTTVQVDIEEPFVSQK